MLTYATSTSTSATDTVSRDAQTVLIVNGDTEVLELLEPVLDAGNYDVVFVESSQHAYSQIKRVQPDLVILCVHMDNPDSLQVLSMLKLDPETRDVPVLTYTSQLMAEEVETAEDDADDSAPAMFSQRPAGLMN
jgi:CheY-like chemotaxis protein